MKLEGGQAHFSGYVSGGLTTPHVYGHLAVTQFSVEGRRFDSLGLDADAAKTRAAVTNGLLQRGPMQMQFAAAVGLDNWSPKPNQPLQATASVRDGDLADVIAITGQSPAGYAGALTADVNVAGSVGNPSGGASLQASNGKILDEPFDRIQARVNLSDQLITVPVRIHQCRLVAIEPYRRIPTSARQPQQRTGACSRAKQPMEPAADSYVTPGTPRHRRHSDAERRRSRQSLADKDPR